MGRSQQHRSHRVSGACRSGNIRVGGGGGDGFATVAGASEQAGRVMKDREKQLAKIVNKRQKTYSTRSHILKQNTHKNKKMMKQILNVSYIH